MTKKAGVAACRSGLSLLNNILYINVYFLFLWAYWVLTKEVAL